MKKASRIFSVILTLTIFALPSVAQVNAKYKQLPHFHQVSPHLYRGAQPKKGGLERLAQLGIKTIVNMRGADDDTRAQKREAHALGLRYYNVPMKWYGRPKDEQVESVLRIIGAPENQPVFIHCRRGADRTGTIAAIYRMLNHGWTNEQAREEADRLKMRWWRFGMKDYISDYYERIMDSSEDN